METFAEIVIGRALNSLPEGLLIALFTWTTLRLLPRQNSRTRFAVWLIALLAVVVLPAAEFGFSERLRSGELPFAGARPWFTLHASWGLFLLAVWAVAAFIASLRVAVGLWRLRELRRSCVPLEVLSMGPEIQKAIADFASSRSITLAQSEQLSVPAAIGFFNPMVIIPSWALKELPSEELSVILLHEFAHLRRWDDWTNLLQKIVKAILVFHPAVWWIENRLSLEREMACDDAVLAETANPKGYAKCLVAFLEKSFARRSLAMAQAAVHRAREASLRLAQILDSRRSRSQSMWKPALGMVGAFSLACLILVPRGPQFVAFDQNPQSVQPQTLDRSALIHAQPGPKVIAAGFHAEQLAPSPQKAHHVHSSRARKTYAAPKFVEHQGVEQILARAPSQPPVGQVQVSEQGTDNPKADLPEMINARAGLDGPEEAVVVVRTAQQVGPNFWIWSVRVLRLTFVPPVQSRTEAPLAKKT
jgi:hypothetical protein